MTVSLICRGSKGFQLQQNHSVFITISAYTDFFYSKVGGLNLNLLTCIALFAFRNGVEN